MDFLHLLEHHILDHPIAAGFSVFGIHMAITKHVVMMWTSAGILMLTLPILAVRWPLVPQGLRGMVEAFVLYIRDEIVLPNTGELGRPYVPYFVSLFFFILVTSLLGLIPGSATATGNIA